MDTELLKELHDAKFPTETYSVNEEGIESFIYPTISEIAEALGDGTVEDTIKRGDKYFALGKDGKIGIGLSQESALAKLWLLQHE